MSEVRKNTCAICSTPIEQQATGRPRLYCSSRCRERGRVRATGVKPTQSQRFWERVRIDGECWVYIGKRDPLGYGHFYLGDGIEAKAHRFAYEDMVAEIPEGLSLDHLCRNTSCVNPAHLEPVTHAVNVERGMAPSALVRRTGKCARDHEMTPENTYHRPDGGGRMCRACQQLRQQRRRAA